MSIYHISKMTGTPKNNKTRSGQPKFSFKEILDSNEKVSDLIHAFGHELGNPLTSIISFGTVIERICENGFETDLAKEQISNYSSLLLQEAWRIGALHERLVHILSVRSTDSSCSDLPSTIAELFERPNPNYQIDSNRIRLELPEDCPKLAIDPDQLHSLLSEVLVNYSESNISTESISTENDLEDPNISVRVIPDPEETSIVISATNEEACPLENLDKAFDPFTSGREERENAGLGLTVATFLVEQNGGSISIREEKVENGFLFTTILKLPTYKESSPKKTTAAPKKNTVSDLPDPLYIVIIEDEETVASAMKKILSVFLEDKTSLDIRIVSGENALFSLRKRSSHQCHSL